MSSTLTFNYNTIRDHPCQFVVKYSNSGYPFNSRYLACTLPNVKKRKQTLIINRLTGIKTISFFTEIL